MEKIFVKDIMVRLDDYATVSEEATLFDAVVALEEAQKAFDSSHSRYHHRAILVLDNRGQVIGKISQMDVFRALEPKYKEMGDRVSLAGFSPKFLDSMMEQYQLWSSSLADLCFKATDKKVKDFMAHLTEGEFVRADAVLEEAIHIFIMGQHHSLLVTEDDKIIGILRLTDAFSKICELIKRCER